MPDNSPSLPGSSGQPEKLRPQPSQRASQIQLQSQEIVVQATMHSGPLPPPEVLQKYEQIVPGTARTIINMAEQQSLHRRQIEKIVIEAGARDSKYGIGAGLLVSLATISLAGFAIHMGHATAGATIATSTVVGLAGVFVYGTRSNREERQQRSQGGQPQATISQQQDAPPTN